jgi:hypothetical protein
VSAICLGFILEAGRSGKATTLALFFGVAAGVIFPVRASADMMGLPEEMEKPAQQARAGVF